MSHQTKKERKKERLIKIHCFGFRLLEQVHGHDLVWHVNGNKSVFMLVVTLVLLVKMFTVKGTHCVWYISLQNPWPIICYHGCLCYSGKVFNKILQETAVDKYVDKSMQTDVTPHSEAQHIKWPNWCVLGSLRSLKRHASPPHLNPHLLNGSHRSNTWECA